MKFFYLNNKNKEDALLLSHVNAVRLLKGCCNELYLVQISGLWIHLGFIAHNTSLTAHQLSLPWSHTALSNYTVHLLLHSTKHTLLKR